VKYLFVVLIFFNLYANELILYSGAVKIKKDRGHYGGFLYSSKSEDETLFYKLGLKQIKIYKRDFTQNENFVSIKEEIDLGRYLEFSLRNIRNDLNDGDIYNISYYIQDSIDWSMGGYFSNYKTDKVYQLNGSFNSFIADTPFYIEPTYFLVTIGSDVYNSLDTKIGYIYSKYDVSLSVLLGKSRYLVKNEYYSCNLGYVLKALYKLEFNYQIDKNFIINIKGAYYDMQNYIKLFSIALKYRY